MIAHHPNTTPRHVPRLTLVMHEYPIPVRISVQIVKMSIEARTEYRKCDEFGSTSPLKLLATGFWNVNPPAAPILTTPIAMSDLMIVGKNAYIPIANACLNFTSALSPKLNVAISTPAMIAMKMMVNSGEL